jgi:hypothetical protein
MALPQLKRLLLGVNWILKEEIEHRLVEASRALQGMAQKK